MSSPPPHPHTTPDAQRRPDRQAVPGLNEHKNKNTQYERLKKITFEQAQGKVASAAGIWTGSKRIQTARAFHAWTHIHTTVVLENTLQEYYTK